MCRPHPTASRSHTFTICDPGRPGETALLLGCGSRWWDFAVDLNCVCCGVSRCGGCVCSKVLLDVAFLMSSPLVSYYILYLIFTLLGNIISPLFFAFHLLDLMYRVDSLRAIVMAVQMVSKQLALTAILVVVIVYMYTIVGFNYFREAYTYENRFGDDVRVPAARVKGVRVCPAYVLGIRVCDMSGVVLHRALCPTCFPACLWCCLPLHVSRSSTVRLCTAAFSLL